MLEHPHIQLRTVLLKTLLAGANIVRLLEAGPTAESLQFGSKEFWLQGRRVIMNSSTSLLLITVRRTSQRTRHARTSCLVAASNLDLCIFVASKKISEDNTIVLKSKWSIQLGSAKCPLEEKETSMPLKRRIQYTKPHAPCRKPRNNSRTWPIWHA